jgi:hypothetical protein
MSAGPGAAAAGPLLDRFAAEARQILPLLALWAHGSLASGDYVPGRSDLDLVALIGAPVTSAQRRGMQEAHQGLIREEPLGAELHCAYIVRGDHADASRMHLTWAHGEFFDRGVSPVSRRELLAGGLCLLGPEPTAVLPAVSDTELANYVRANLRDYWYPKTSLPVLWLKDIWVDQGMMTLARATVTLRDGRLITKRAALDVLAGLGTPADLLTDIRDRRYGTKPPASPGWRAHRGKLARNFVRLGIERTLGPHLGAPR